MTTIATQQVDLDNTLVPLENQVKIGKCNMRIDHKKAPAKADRSKGINLLSEAALLEEAQVKKVLKRSGQETTIHQVGSSSDGAGLQPKVLDEPKGKSVDTHKGTGLKSGVFYVSKADSFESEYKS
nr:hypothetical protein [Tanacetum cinerariifolium]